MTLAFASALNLMTSFSLCAYATTALLTKIETNSALTKNLWFNEYRAHQCGRSLAALANIRAIATQRFIEGRDRRELIEKVHERIRSMIYAHIGPDFQISETGCFERAHQYRVAELYQRDRHHSDPADPKYTYRILTGL